MQPHRRSRPVKRGAEQLEDLRKFLQHMEVIEVDDGLGNMVRTIRFHGANVQIVSGGFSNTAHGNYSSVSGGSNRSALNTDDWVAGSLFEDNYSPPQRCLSRVLRPHDGPDLGDGSARARPPGPSSSRSPLCWGSRRTSRPRRSALEGRAHRLAELGVGRTKRGWNGVSSPRLSWVTRIWADNKLGEALATAGGA